MPNVFISYSRKDHEAADYIAENLKNREVSVFIDREKLKGGDDFTERLGREIEGCDYFVLLFSNNSALSKWVKNETNYAYHKERNVIPVILDDVQDLAAWFPIVRLHQVDFRRWNSDRNMSGAINNLLVALGITIDNINETGAENPNGTAYSIVAPGGIGFASGRYSDQVTFREFENVLGEMTLYKSTESQTSKVWARWTPSLYESGAYEIQAYIPKTHSSTKNARYKINNVSNSSNEIIVEIDQSKHDNEWITLGSYFLDKRFAGAGTVFLNDLTGELANEISFTSIRFKPVEALG